MVINPGLKEEDVLIQDFEFFCSLLCVDAFFPFWKCLVWVLCTREDHLDLRVHSCNEFHGFDERYAVVPVIDTTVPNHYDIILGYTWQDTLVERF